MHGVSPITSHGIVRISLNVRMTPSAFEPTNMHQQMGLDAAERDAL
jgi:hypothetical protein